MKIEICLDSPDLAIEAQKHGAHRVELCANLMEGGTTPSVGCIAATRKAIDIGLFVIIRPRGGHFYYNALELEQMKYDVQLCKDLGADGVVIGLLTKDGNIDIENTKTLIEIARPMEVTFHRAFDRCKNPFLALEQLMELGVDRILTSGQEPKAINGINLLAKLVEKAADRIIIMPGSGVNPSNIQTLKEKTKAKEFHFTSMKQVTASGGYKHPAFADSGYVDKQFDVEKIESCIKNLE